MAFAAKGSRPNPNDTKHRSSGKALEDNRLPTIIAVPTPPRERVVRKPPVPRILAKSNPPLARPAKRAGGALPTTNVRVAARRKQEPVTKVKVKSPLSGGSQPGTSRVNSKPALPPKLKANQTQVAPDSLTISSQLAPWIYMRSSLKGMLQQLENETESILKAEKEKLHNAEKLVEESQLRVDLNGQKELLEDLCDKKNADFSSSLSLITKDLFSFIAQSDTSSIFSMNLTLEALQDMVYSTDGEGETLEKLSGELDAVVKQGQAIEHRLNELLRITQDPEHVLRATLRYPSRWKTLLERFTSLLDLRIRNLHALKDAALSVASYQNRRMGLQVMDAALS